jgi:hypothetical protein
MRRLATVLAGFSLLLGAGACSKGNSAKEDRKRLVDELVKAGRSRQQAECVVSHVDDDLLKMMRANTPPPPNAPSFAAYSKAIGACIDVK